MTTTKTRTQPVLDDEVTVTLTFTLTAPEKKKDRVQLDQLIGVMIDDLDGGDYWPEPTEAIKEWAPDEPYAVSVITRPDLSGHQVMLDAPEPGVGSKALVADIVWKRSTKMWIPAASGLVSLAGRSWQDLHDLAEEGGPLLILVYQ